MADYGLALLCVSWVLKVVFSVHIATCKDVNNMAGVLLIIDALLIAFGCFLAFPELIGPSLLLLVFIFMFSSFMGSKVIFKENKLSDTATGLLGWVPQLYVILQLIYTMYPGK